MFTVDSFIILQADTTSYVGVIVNHDCQHDFLLARVSPNLVGKREGTSTSSESTFGRLGRCESSKIYRELNSRRAWVNPQPIKKMLISSKFHIFSLLSMSIIMNRI